MSDQDDAAMSEREGAATTEREQEKLGLRGGRPMIRIRVSVSVSVGVNGNIYVRLALMIGSALELRLGNNMLTGQARAGGYGRGAWRGAACRARERWGHDSENGRNQDTSPGQTPHSRGWCGSASGFRHHIAGRGSGLMSGLVRISARIRMG